jgi:hypothetical protein
VNDAKLMASLLNNTSGKAFTREDTTKIPDPAEVHEGENISSIRITVKEVRKKIHGLRREAAAGPDGIGPGLLKELADELAPVLTHIFNSSLATGEVPSDWKEANVAPIFKKGRQTAPENYHPVSLTSVCCKILESVVKDRIMEHLKKIN